MFMAWVKPFNAHGDQSHGAIVLPGLARHAVYRPWHPPGQLNRVSRVGTMILPMRTGVTIALTYTHHNNSPRVVGRSMRSCATRAALLCIWLAGCSIAWPPPAATTEVPAWELANAKPALSRQVGRARLDPERPLPPEFTLLCINNATDWGDLRGRYGLVGSPGELDFSQGAVVGLIANVGEGPRGIWPVELDQVRIQNGQGSVEYTFAAGLYYPVRTAGYLDLAYIPGLREVRMVRIGQRRFIIRSGAGH
jgi:hypothetical protein